MTDEPTIADLIADRDHLLAQVSEWQQQITKLNARIAELLNEEEATNDRA